MPIDKNARIAHCIFNDNDMMLFERHETEGRSQTIHEGA